tara:strand:+ start:5000 stop:5356 length:357 start_codon:yes stop_codon:yes gene_type:complete
MPTYTFYDEASGIEWEEFLSISEKEKFLNDNPQIKQIIQPVAIVGDHVMGVGPKVDGGFTENMQRIAAAHPDSPMASRWGGDSRSHKEIKTRNTINKHAKRVAREGFSANKGKTLADK